MRRFCMVRRLQTHDRSARTGSAWRTLGTSVLALAIGLVAAGALGEAVVRGFDLPPHRLAALGHQNFMLSDDPVLKYEYRPGYDGPLDARALTFAINADGFRDHPYTKSKPT